MTGMIAIKVCKMWIDKLADEMLVLTLDVMFYQSHINGIQLINVHSVMSS